MGGVAAGGGSVCLFVGLDFVRVICDFLVVCLLVSLF